MEWLKLKEIQIATGVSRNFLDPLLVMITSLAENNKSENIIFNIFHEDFLNDDINKVKIKISKYDNIKLKFFEILEDMVRDLPLTQHFRIATYFRILSPVLLPKEDKLIYLDTDIIIDGSIRELWEVDITDYTLAAVREEAVLALDKRLKMPSDYKYFNAGIVLLNLKRIREEDKFEKVFLYLKNNAHELLYLDQDALNAVLYDEWLEIDEKWNYHNTFILKREGKLKNVLLDNPVIIHYTGPLKPWHKESKHILKSKYEKYKFILDDFENKNKINKVTIFSEKIKLKIIKFKIFVYGKIKSNKLCLFAYKKFFKFKKFKNIIVKLKSKHAPPIQVMKSFEAKVSNIKFSSIESDLEILISKFREFDIFIHIEGYVFKRNFSDRFTKKYVILETKNKKYVFILNNVDILELNEIYFDEIDYSKSGFFNFINKKNLESGNYIVGFAIEKNGIIHFKRTKMELFVN